MKIYWPERSMSSLEKFTLPIILTLIIACAFPCGAVAQSWYELYRAGVDSYQKGNYEACADYMGRAFGEKPENGTMSVNGGKATVEYYPHWYLCECFTQLGDTEKAECHCEGKRSYEHFVECICEKSGGMGGTGDVEVVHTFEVPTFGRSAADSTGGEGRGAMIRAISPEGGATGSQYVGGYNVEIKIDEGKWEEESGEYVSWAVPPEGEAVAGGGEEDEGPKLVKIEDKGRMSRMEREARAAVEMASAIKADVAGESEKAVTSRRREKAMRYTGETQEAVELKNIQVPEAPAAEESSRRDASIRNQERKSYGQWHPQQQQQQQQQQPEKVGPPKPEGRNRPPEIEILSPYYTETGGLDNRHGEAWFECDFVISDPDSWVTSVFVNGEEICSTGLRCNYYEKTNRCWNKCMKRMTHNVKYTEPGRHKIEIKAVDDNRAVTTKYIEVKVVDFRKHQSVQ